MPLRKDSKRRSAELGPKPVDDSASDTITLDDQEGNAANDDDDDDEAQDALLESLGIENSEILKINHSQVRDARDFFRFICPISRIVFLNLVSGKKDHGEGEQSGLFEAISRVCERRGDPGVVQLFN